MAKNYEEHAKERLQQARYELRSLKKENDKIAPHDNVAFESHRNAFLNSAYSIINAVEKQADEQGIRWDGDIIPAADANYLRSMTGKRGADVHGKGAAVKQRFKAIPAEGVDGFHPSSLGLPHELAQSQEEFNKDVGLPPGTFAWTFKSEYHFRGKGEVVQACEKCLSILGDLVTQFPWTSPIRSNSS